MKRTAVSVDIAAPPARVWAVMRDVVRWPEWTASVKSVELLDGRPFAVGTRVRIRQPRFPPALWRVTELDDERRTFSWESRAPGLLVVGRHEVVPSADGSRALLSLEFSGMLGGPWERLTRDLTARYVRMEAEGLRARSESVQGV